MTVQDILLKRSVNEAEMTYVVEQYIRARRGVKVNIRLGRVNWGRNFGGREFVTSSPNDVNLLSIAFGAAAEWFAHNRDQQA